MKKTFTIAWLVVLGTCLTIGAPRASAQNREHQQIMADIRMLQEQAQQLAIVLTTLTDTLKAINGRMDQQTETARKSFADQKLLIDNLSADLRVIRERSDETNVRISSLDQEIEALRTAIPTMMTPPPAVAADPNAPVDPNAPPPAPVAPPPPSVAGLSPRRMYDTAFADYTASQCALAIQGFEAFLRTFLMSDLADDAQYFIGETYYASGRYPEAVTAYNQVIQRYATSNSTPDAYYKIGRAHV